jgi:uncharacterized surface protein with fasciclin (FAS1) repeats
MNMQINVCTTAMATLVGTALVWAPTAAAQCGTSKPATTTAQVAAYDYAKKDIVDTAVAAGQFKTLLAAAEAAGLVSALKGDGPLTVFAPTDAAFSKLPDGTVEKLLKPENRAKLQAVLKYHVVSGKLMAKDVTKAPGAVSLEGQMIDFTTKDGKVMVDDARVAKADVKASNGVIHVIDAVILPASENIVTTASEAGAFKTLLAAAKAAGLAETLASDGPFTVFAPTDEAFAALPDGTVESLLKPENKSKLQEILKLHVVSGRVYSPDVVKIDAAPTLAGKVPVKTMGSKVNVGNASVVKTDIDASNGVIHVIDAVILPDAASKSAAAY